METYERTNARPISIDVLEKRWTLLGHTFRSPKETPGNRVITQYFQSRAVGANEKRQPTRRGRVLTTLPRLLQRDLKEKLTAHERKTHFNVDDLESGRQLDILRMTATNRNRWRSGVDMIIEKARMRWIQTNSVKSRKRGGEDGVWSMRVRSKNKKRREENRSDKRQRTIHQYFRF